MTAGAWNCNPAGELELERELPRAAGSGRVVSIELRYFDGAILVDPHPRLVDPGVAIYVDGSLDRIEWTHAREDGLEERHVAPAASVVRYWTIRDPDGGARAPREPELET